MEDLTVGGTVRGSILHIHRARTVIINSDGLISASALGGVNFLKGSFLCYVIKFLLLRRPIDYTVIFFVVWYLFRLHV